MDAKNLAALDQARACLSNEFAETLWHFYKGLKRQGFKETEALLLTNELLRSALAVAVKPR